MSRPQPVEKASICPLGPNAKPVEIARKALEYIGMFPTPPTPDVYQVWYRYVEGENEALCEQLSFAINETRKVDRGLLTRLHKEFCRDQESSELNIRTSDDLVAELAGLQSLIESQVETGAEFDSQVSSASSLLQDENLTTESFRDAVKKVLASNAAMQSELETVQSRLRTTQHQVEKMRSSLVESQRELITDPLTGCGNRRFFESTINKLVAQASSDSQTKRCLLLIDLDNFKAINDTFGHECGDMVLRFVVAELSKLAPEAEIARFGGDEFAVFLSADSLQCGGDLAHAIIEAIANRDLTFQSSGQRLGRITTSIGVALLRPDDTRESWLVRADKLLYGAKESGRNCVMVERSLGLRENRRPAFIAP